jgi:hypothetical protein
LWYDIVSVHTRTTMPKFLCRCSIVISTSDIPCEHEWLMISDVAYDKFEGSVDADALYRAMTGCLRCPSCGRLWIYWNGYQQEPTEYVPA